MDLPSAQRPRSGRFSSLSRRVARVSKRAAVAAAVAAVLTLGATGWRPVGSHGSGCAAVGAPPPPMATTAATTDGGSGGAGSALTTADIEAAAKKLGVTLKENIVGPWYQMELYSGDRQVGKTSGWAQPWGILHLETIEVRRFTGYWVKSRPKPRLSMGNSAPQAEEPEKPETTAEEDKRYADVAKVARWFGLLLAASIAVWNRERSPVFCKEAHLLAINDEEKQHRGLVRYYKGLGFKTLREGDELTFQDQVAWGGQGTLMNVTDEEFMEKWTPIVRQLGRQGAGVR
eukprot:TRINITY_DN103889_c0_g1_i1.p1 TRINITY_DN103889_c0_g1~~TRINITY_DN103889_c0_g1_i1.p1  ORF type:complete len:302 (-),score=53.74 TRINITY_DN103889_c0_g1_i1:296-1159(-)